MSGLLNPSAVRELASSVGLTPTKRWGQNFVVDANTVRRLVTLAGVESGDQVLEVGPGLGSLTLGLLEAGASVVAVEIDAKLAQLLPQTVAQRLPEAVGRLDVIEGDALRLSPVILRGASEASEVAGSATATARQSDQADHATARRMTVAPPAKLVANLPYNVAVPVVLTLLERFDDLTDGLVMVQLEVARRLTAEPGSKVYGVPSAKLAWFAEAEFAGTVPASVFWPVPNVESGLVRFTRHNPPSATPRDKVFAVIDAAFAQRRKMLRSALAPLASSQAVASALDEAGVEQTARGETCTVAQFAAIAQALFSEQ
ncbi:MAG: 16S rRNA (adenine(1518)-N(6)/adenine(1519)-N(6))-dimethyltransferase RsmA [Propionibacteriaceae bacterium]|nr:16S rRNA (adenine(1518)-N(6)/adenine(1519)-N(6))-dimethyltransferase RsmA [Propionibacteriaceae bacterium]